MAKSRIALIVAAIAAFLGVAGVAFALVGDDDRSVPEVPAPALGVVAQGTAPSGPYTISKVDLDGGSTMFCYEIATKAAKAQGCTPIPDAKGQFEGKPVKPGQAVLGTDRFVSILAPDGVETMRVTTGDDTVAARSIDIDGVGRLLVATTGGAPVTSDAPDPDRVAQFLDSQDRVVREQPLPGTSGQ